MFLFFLFYCVFKLYFSSAPPRLFVIFVLPLILFSSPPFYNPLSFSFPFFFFFIFLCSMVYTLMVYTYPYMVYISTYIVYTLCKIICEFPFSESVTQNTKMYQFVCRENYVFYFLQFPKFWNRMIRLNWPKTPIVFSK